MSLRIRLVTSSDEGGLHLRDVCISDAWRNIHLKAMDAFHIHLCDLLATEGVSLDALALCTPLSLWYVSDNSNTWHNLTDPCQVPPGSLVFFDTLSAKLTQVYTKPSHIHVYDLDDISGDRVLKTHSPSKLLVCLDGKLEIVLPFPMTMDSCKLMPWVVSSMATSGIFIHSPRAYVTHSTWGGQLIDYTGRHQIRGGTMLRIAGAVEMNSRTLPMPV